MDDFELLIEFVKKAFREAGFGTSIETTEPHFTNLIYIKRGSISLGLISITLDGEMNSICHKPFYGRCDSDLVEDHISFFRSRAVDVVVLND